LVNVENFAMSADFDFEWYIPSNTPPPSSWIKEEHKNQIQPNGFQGYSFPLNAARIRFTLSSSESSDM
jgi:hypothetical protein